jgi:uncharacterized lipoprotein YddW (UPF0748 family)
MGSLYLYNMYKNINANCANDEKISQQSLCDFGKIFINILVSSYLCKSPIFLMRNILFFLSMLLISLHAQIERETRAVWLTTNHRLDWPPQTYNAEKQKQALIEILDNIKSKNLNTIYFQVRSNGTILFNSSFEPFSPYITGEVDETPSYDPLKFAIEQAHKRGLEIHAWLNIVKVFEGKDISTIKNQDHICLRKPEWIIEDYRDGQKAYWLDPGLPEVRMYISDMITELAENYDVDGIHLDYIRYPGKNFDDDFSYNLFGNNRTRDEYRRNNITALVEEISKKVKSVNRFIKIGAAPIGIYKRLKGMNGWESYYDLYQDSYEWLKKGIVDYLTPQTYWGLEENPSFDLLAKDWVANSAGRNIVLGIAAYKTNVKAEIDKMINFSRSINSAGVSFFRYEHIKNLSLYSFTHKAFPALMPWLESIYPPAPQDLIALIENPDKNIFSLKWQNGTAGDNEDSISYYAVYNLSKKNAAPLTEYLFDVLSAPRSSVKLAIEKPKKVEYYFTVKSVNKVWNESKLASNVVSIQIPVMKNILELGNDVIKPFMVKGENQGALIFLSSNKKDKINIYGLDGSRQILFAKLSIAAGYNILSVGKIIFNYKNIRIVRDSDRTEVELHL